MIEDLLYSLELKIIKRYSNAGLNLYQYFLKKTGIHPENVIIIKNFIFFFIKNQYYFRAKRYLNYIRKQMPEKKILIIRVEDSIIKLIMGFFPDIYIHDIKCEIDDQTGDIIMSVYFLSFEERKIAVGSSGSYIKAVNEIFEKFIIPVKIKCAIIDI